MSRIHALHALTPLLLGGVLALGTALPASAARQVREDGKPSNERKPHPTQAEQPRIEQPRIGQPRVEPPRAERPWAGPRIERAASSDDQRRENWGELARQQQERRRAESPRPSFEPRPMPQPGQEQSPRPQFDRDQQRQRFQARREALQQPADEQRAPAPPQDDVGSRSLQARIIAESRARENQRNGRQPSSTQRPDWRDDRHDGDRDNRPDWRGDRDGISQAEQRQRIEEQRRQQAQWQRDEQRRHGDYQRYHRDLEHDRRHAQYRYQQDYWRRWQAAQRRWNSYRYDYYNDPFFYTPFNYRYSHGGRWYSTNRYGAELLQQAVRDGYREGWRAGRADAADRWRFDYRGNFGYLDGSYGYDGYYVSLDDYRYYFRQGFERGYRDGYYDRDQYGSYRDGDALILPAVLGLILAFSIH